MLQFLTSQRTQQKQSQHDHFHFHPPPRLEDSYVPVAVTAFDIQSLRGKVLQTGSMARAARASATFPFLFQPVGWIEERGGGRTHYHRNHSDNNELGTEESTTDYMFIDGGITDPYGLVGINEIISKSIIENDGPQQHEQLRDHFRVINLMVGDFHFSTVPGPSSIVLSTSSSSPSQHNHGDGISNHPVSVLSISIQNLPQCGPWAMSNGPIAVQAAKRAMVRSMDVPLFLGKEPNHYELHIDASYFLHP
jgi:hypothetical protein